MCAPCGKIKTADFEALRLAHLEDQCLQLVSGVTVTDGNEGPTEVKTRLKDEKKEEGV